VSRKGDKGGPAEGGEEGDGGGDNPDVGPDGAPQQRQHAMASAAGAFAGGMGAGNMGHGMPGGSVGMNMPHHANGNTHLSHHPHGPSHLHTHGPSGHPSGPGSHMTSGMMKHPAGGYTGPNGGADGHNHSVGGPSSIHGIKTEMKYAGSAHPMQTSHLQGHGMGHHAQGGAHHHALPSIPQSIYTPGAVGTANQNTHHGHHSGMVNGLNRPLGPLGSGSHHGHYNPAPAHSMLSQSQQQKVHPPLNGQSHSGPGSLNLGVHNVSHGSNVPTGLLLSGPSSALLHSTGSSSNGSHHVTTLPSVASHPAAGAVPPIMASSAVGRPAMGAPLGAARMSPAPSAVPPPVLVAGPSVGAPAVSVAAPMPTPATVPATGNAVSSAPGTTVNAGPGPAAVSTTINFPQAAVLPATLPVAAAAVATAAVSAVPLPVGSAFNKQP
jgi:hypothetical protein